MAGDDYNAISGLYGTCPPAIKNVSALPYPNSMLASEFNVKICYVYSTHSFSNVDIFNTDTWIVSDYDKPPFENYPIEKLREYIDENTILCTDGNWIDNSISEIYIIPKTINEVYEPNFMFIAAFNGTIDGSEVEGPLFKQFSNRFQKQLGRGPLEYIENIKIPFTIDEIIAMVTDFSELAVLYKDYTGTFEFSDGTKKTFAELSALFS